MSKIFVCVNVILNVGWILCVQLRQLRAELKQLGSQLCDIQHDMICEEQDLAVVHTRLQQMNPEDPQYVRISVPSANNRHCVSTILVFILLFLSNEPRDAIQHTECLFQARITWEGGSRKGICCKNGEDDEGSLNELALVWIISVDGRSVCFTCSEQHETYGRTLTVISVARRCSRPPVAT